MNTMILGRATEWPPAWPQETVTLTGETQEIADLWTGYQRVLSKQAWLEGCSGGSVWPLERGEPAVVAFFSFKGGVGRSTLLGVTAWQLAKAGSRVVCLDLDLEAPGLSGLLDVRASESLIDHLLTHAATGQLPSDDPVTPATVHGVNLGVVAAGLMDRGYIEKLARLDYLGTSAADDSPVAKALQLVLERIKGQHRPDYILLDCRTGLHDLGGLSLTDLAHVDVLVGRDTPSGRDGLGLTLEVLGARRPAQDQRVVIVQTFVPLPLKGEAAELTRDRFRSSMYDKSVETLYRTLDTDPTEEDTGAAHYPWPIGQYNEIAAGEHLSSLSESVLANDAFTAVRRRIEALAAREDDPDSEEAHAQGD